MENSEEEQVFFYPVGEKWKRLHEKRASDVVITASMAGELLGLSKYKSSKKAIEEYFVAPYVEPSDAITAMFIGSMKEPLIFLRIVEMLGTTTLVYQPNSFQSPTLKFLYASADALVCSPEGIFSLLEIKYKTTNTLPKTLDPCHFVQVLLQLHCYRIYDVGLVAYNHGDLFKFFRVHRDEVLIAKILCALEDIRDTIREGDKIISFSELKGEILLAAKNVETYSE